MTDREAIRRLAEICNALAIDTRRSDIMQEAGNLIRDLAEPAAPTVTQEQAAWIEQVVAGAIRSRPGMGIAAEIEATILNYPAFFRAVADALEGK